MNQETQHLIDYLTITKPKLRLEDDGAIAAYLMNFDPCEVWESIHPMNGYRNAIRNATGAIGQTTTTAQGSYLSWSGQALKSVDARVVGERAIRDDWRITRVDLAIDFYNFPTTVEDYKQEFMAGQCNTTARSWDERLSQNGGHTFYIGSYSSERFMRIYDKKAETLHRDGIQTPQSSWVRCELKLSDAPARAAFGMLSGAELSSVIPSILRGYADFPNIEEYARSDTYPVHVPGEGRKNTNTERWLLETVAPALAREIRLRPEFYKEFSDRLEALINLD
jgi:hypothetical protein